MSDNETPQIVVNPTPTLDQIAAAARTVVLVLGVLGALAGIISRRDWSAFILYMQSSDFLTAASAIAGFGAFAWGQWKTRHRAKQLATVAADPRVPDAVATLKAAA